MAIPAGLVGARSETIEHTVDSRWTMAYAAAVDDLSVRYFDTTRPDELVAHPVFPVCVEWPAILSAGEAYGRLGVPLVEVLAGVHATHDLSIHRLVRPGDRLWTSAEVVGIEQITPGTKVTQRLRTVDADDRPVATTTQTTVHLGVQLDGEDHPDPEPPPPLPAGLSAVGTGASGLDRRAEVEIRAGQAHRYTEGARIWNPIHTDLAVAHSAGLPDLILHGTANLAYAVSTILAAEAIDPVNVRRIQCRFRAMVTMPSTLTVSWAPTADTAEAAMADGSIVPEVAVWSFVARNDGGKPAVDAGYVVVGPSPDDNS